MSSHTHLNRHPSRRTLRTATATFAAAIASAGAFVALSPAGAIPARITSARLLEASVVQVAPGTSLSSVHPAAGSTYAFARGATYTGTLDIGASNVTIKNYGSATERYPIFSRNSEGSDILVTGSNVTIAHIRITGQGYQAVSGCGSAQTAGYEVGIDLRGDHDTVRGLLAYGNLYAGVYVETAGSYATITRSRFRGVNALNPDNLGSGAFAILLWGSHNTIDHDTFNNQSTCSPDYGTDGSGVEIYHGSDNLIENSRGRNDSDFTELGGAGATGNSFLNNTFAAPGEFLVTRGSGDAADGPVTNTILTGNVAHGAVVSYDWQSGDGTLLTMKDNHVARLSQDGGYVDAGGNVIGF
jgi:parallel beta helix pectate lyase-like protein